MAKAKTQKDDGPTPYLNVRKSRNQHFTYAENVLLDQITMEITEAWAKDLTVIRKCHKEIKESLSFFIDAEKVICEKCKNIDELLSKQENIYKLEKVLDSIRECFGFMNEVRKEVLDMNNKMNFPEVTKFASQLKEIHLDYKGLKETVHKLAEHIFNPPNPKKWWKFWK